MWGGEINGLAKLKFSGSPNNIGNRQFIIKNKIEIIIIMLISLIENKGWKEDLSLFNLILDGLDEPDEWRNNRWIMTIADMIKGRIKWNEKNRFSVGLFTEKSPQIHLTMFLPENGITDIRFVITVVPQKDIWPQGNT